VDAREVTRDESREAGTTDEDSDGSVLEWSVRLVTKRPLRAAGMTLFIIAIWVGLYFVYREPWWVIFAVLLLGGSVFFPLLTVTRYRFDHEGVRNFYPDPNGVLLSPFSTPSRLENFRGIYLRFGDNRREVLAYLEGIYPQEETSVRAEGVEEPAHDKGGADRSGE